MKLDTELWSLFFSCANHHIFQFIFQEDGAPALFANNMD